MGLSFPNDNFYLRDAVQKIDGIFWELFPRGGVFPIPKTFKKMALETP